MDRESPTQRRSGPWAGQKPDGPQRPSAPGRVQARAVLAGVSAAGRFRYLPAAPREGQSRGWPHPSHLSGDVGLPTSRSVHPSLHVPRFRPTSRGRKQPRKRRHPALPAELHNPRPAPRHLQLRVLVRRMRARTPRPPDREFQRAPVAARGEASERLCLETNALTRVEPATHGLKGRRSAALGAGFSRRCDPDAT